MPSPATERALRPLLVGQAPARGAEGRPALAGSASGRRLARLAGLDGPGGLDELLRLVDAVNLSTVWRPSAEMSVGFLRRDVETVHALAVGRRVVVCLGYLVARALGVPAAPWYERRDGYAIVPHPSGRSRYWNDAANVYQAERFWRGLVDETRRLR